MTHHLRVADAGVVTREIGDWADTETYKDILRSLELVRATDKPAMTMIAGVPGIGKTTAVRSFCHDEGHDGIYVQAAKGEGTAWNFAKALSNLWYSRPIYNTLTEARMILANYIGKRRVLIVDEAQYLYQRNKKTGQVGDAFEWLRAMSEEGQFDLVFCGDLTLPNAISSMPQLQSRMLRPVVVYEVSRADVAAVVEGTAFASSTAIDALHAIAKLKGGLRNVENVTRIASLFAGQDVPTLAHLKAAIVDMKLAPKGRV